MTRRVLVPVICAVVAALAGFGLGFSWIPAADEPPPVLTNTEIEWARTMAAHHEQAVLLTQNLAEDIDPHVTLLAHRIELTQMKEIGELRGWLRLAEVSQTDITDSHTRHDGSMPGMATWEEIDTLRTAVGVDAEIGFLQLMVRHHHGGVDMAVAGAREAHSPAVRAVALSMIDDQAGEIEVMVRMLRARAADLLPYP